MTKAASSSFAQYIARITPIHDHTHTPSTHTHIILLQAHVYTTPCSSPGAISPFSFPPQSSTRIAFPVHGQHEHYKDRMEGFTTLRATVQATMETHCPEVSPSLLSSLPPCLLAVWAQGGRW